jgi:hypothetical protein
MSNDVSTTVSQLEALDQGGELKDAFSEATSCRELAPS